MRRNCNCNCMRPFEGVGVAFCWAALPADNLLTSELALLMSVVFLSVSVRAVRRLIRPCNPSSSRPVSKNDCEDLIGECSTLGGGECYGTHSSNKAKSLSEHPCQRLLFHLFPALRRDR
jgi:hypothetical protein